MDDAELEARTGVLLYFMKDIARRADFAVWETTANMLAVEAISPHEAALWLEISEDELQRRLAQHQASRADNVRRACEAVDSALAQVEQLRRGFEDGAA